MKSILPEVQARNHAKEHLDALCDGFQRLNRDLGAFPFKRMVPEVFYALTDQAIQAIAEARDALATQSSDDANIVVRRRRGSAHE